MFLSISRDFIKQAESSSKEIFESCRDILNSALWKCYLHKHVFVCDRLTLDELLSKDWIYACGKKYLSWFKKSYIDVMAFYDKFNKRIEFTFESNSTKIVKKELVYLIKYDSLEEIKDSILLSENDSDFDFYMSISYLTQKFPGFSISLENGFFSGSNVSGKINNVDKYKQFCYAIVDSDCEPYRFQFGNTAKNAINAYSKMVNKFLPFKLYILNVREKENVFPLHYYCVYYSNLDAKTKKCFNRILNTSDETIERYFDIKDGIKLKRFKEDITKWTEKYRNLLNDFENEKLYVNRCQIQCSDKCSDCDKKYISGIGDKALSIAMKSFCDENLIIKEKDFNEVCHQSYLYTEWKRISYFAWLFGSCVDEKIKFNN